MYVDTNPLEAATAITPRTTRSTSRSARRSVMNGSFRLSPYLIVL